MLMWWSKTLVLVAATGFLFGCASDRVTPTQKGAAVGAAGGAALGAIVGHQSGETGAGAAIGAGVGAITGALIGDQMDEKSAQKKKQEQEKTEAEEKGYQRGVAEGTTQQAPPSAPAQAPAQAAQGHWELVPTGQWVEVAGVAKVFVVERIESDGRRIGHWEQRRFEGSHYTTYEKVWVAGE